VPSFTGRAGLLLVKLSLEDGPAGVFLSCRCDGRSNRHVTPHAALVLSVAPAPRERHAEIGLRDADDSETPAVNARLSSRVEGT